MDSFDRWIFPTERTEDADGAFAKIGRALTYATAYEAACRSLSTILSIRNRLSESCLPETESDERFNETVAAIWEKHLFQHIKTIVRLVPSGGSIQNGLTSARIARNCIAHEFMIGRHNPESTQIGIELIQISRTLAIGSLLVEIAILQQQNYPIPPLQYISDYPQRIVSWITES